MNNLNSESVESKLFNLGLILTSLIGYLEWGGGNGMFLFQGEAEVLSKFVTDPMSIVHPFIILPIFGQLLLLVTIFQKIPNKTLTYIGFGCIGILLGFILLIGVIGLHYKLLFSTLPFFILGYITIRNLKGYRK